MNRRDLIKGSIATAIAVAVPTIAVAKEILYPGNPNPINWSTPAGVVHKQIFDLYEASKHFELEEYIKELHKFAPWNKYNLIYVGPATVMYGMGPARIREIGIHFSEISDPWYGFRTTRILKTAIPYHDVTTRFERTGLKIIQNM